MFKKIASKTTARLNVSTLINKILTVHLPNFISNVLGMPSLSVKIQQIIDYIKKSLDIMNLLKESILVSYNVFLEKKNAKKVISTTVESVKEIVEAPKNLIIGAAKTETKEQSTDDEYYDDKEVDEPEDTVSSAVKHIVSNVGDALMGSSKSRNVMKLKKKKSSSLINFNNEKEDE